MRGLYTHSPRAGATGRGPPGPTPASEPLGSASAAHTVPHHTIITISACFPYYALRDCSRHRAPPRRDDALGVGRQMALGAGEVSQSPERGVGKVVLG